MGVSIFKNNLTYCLVKDGGKYNQYLYKFYDTLTELYNDDFNRNMSIETSRDFKELFKGDLIFNVEEFLTQEELMQALLKEHPEILI